MNYLKLTLPLALSPTLLHEDTKPINTVNNNHYNHNYNYSNNHNNKPTKSRRKVKLARKANLKRINNHK